MKKAIIIGLSGCSSSGKTTLARLLRDIFPNTMILHEDDFYLPEARIPRKGHNLDWDCPEALDVPLMAKSLDYISRHAIFPPTLHSTEDLNSIGPCPITTQKSTDLKTKVFSLLSSLPASHPIHSSQLRICILDGFLLYTKTTSAALRPYLDLKFFVRASYQRAKARRAARPSYVTVEGFWDDPPGYFDELVWPNYREGHAWMFEGGDVEGRYDMNELGKAGIKVIDRDTVDGNMEESLEWLVNSILNELLKYNQ